MRKLLFVILIIILIGCKTEDEFSCGTEKVTYQSQEYNTVQIGDQCWLKENLNVGTMIDSLENMKDNGIIEKYCYRNKEDSCTKYGGLYQWNEMMQYATQQGARGICPPGWHLPKDEEWSVLEGAVDSQYGIGEDTWDDYGFRGYDAGTNLKATSGWYANGNGTDLFGFSGLPGGSRSYYGGFLSVGFNGYCWTSSSSYINFNAFSRYLDYSSPGVRRDYGFGQELGFSVRCLRDN
jgi:uncharacterized protein (TIGR02145 family)